MYRHLSITKPMTTIDRDARDDREAAIAFDRLPVREQVPTGWPI